ncbi:hypothetical protein BKA81DRAFT_374900 [Phyllosticta paracitricarpa]
MPRTWKANHPPPTYPASRPGHLPTATKAVSHGRGLSSAARATRGSRNRDVVTMSISAGPPHGAWSQAIGMAAAWLTCCWPRHLRTLSTAAAEIDACLSPVQSKTQQL